MFFISDVNKPSTNSLWHYRICHAHFPAIRLSLKHYNIYISNKGPNLFCKSYYLDKSQRIRVQLYSIMYTTFFKVERTNF